MLRALGLIAGMVLLSGCAEKWEKLGASAQEFDGMKAGCSTRAYAMFPPMMQQIQLTGGYVTPVSMSCSYAGYMQDCIQTGGQYMAPVTMMVDNNKAGRTQATRSCFFGNGWTPVEQR